MLILTLPVNVFERSRRVSIPYSEISSFNLTKFGDRQRHNIRVDVSLRLFPANFTLYDVTQVTRVVQGGRLT